jgi:flagellar biosynthesis/type III secretory pathway M-ring protein FliF/YscJ
MNDIPQANGKSKSRAEKIASYVIQFVAVVTALHIGRMWNDYAWYWNIVIDIGIYVAVVVAAWVLYRAVEKAWTYSRRTQ